MAEFVRFKIGTSAQYDASAKAQDTLYFVTDTKQIYKGTEDYTSSIFVVDSLPSDPIKTKVYIVGKRAYTFKELDGAYQWFMLYDLESIEDDIKSIKSTIESYDSTITNAINAASSAETAANDATDAANRAETAVSEVTQELQNITQSVQDAVDTADLVASKTEHLSFRSEEDAISYLNDESTVNIFYGRRISIIDSKGQYKSYVVEPGTDNVYTISPVSESSSDSSMIWSNMEDDIIYILPDSIESLSSALASPGVVNVEIANDISLTTDQTITIPSGTNATVKIDEGVTITTDQTAFSIEDGATLTLTGTGAIQTNTKKAKGIVNVSGPNAKLIIDGVTLDSFDVNGSVGNYSYGVYASQGATVSMWSGIIHVGQGCCISTNNTTGGGNINIYGGELYSEGSYAIYNPAQGNINVAGGKVQGINARMGNITISGSAEIIPTTIDETNYDDIGSNISTTGCIWLGDTIALVAGTYSDTNGTDTILKIKDTAKVTSNYRSAIGIYSIDTKEDATVQVVIDKTATIETADTNYDNIKVYDHQYISDAATAKGKTYDPTHQSTININVGSNQIYPAA